MNETSFKKVMTSFKNRFYRLINATKNNTEFLFCFIVYLIVCHSCIKYIRINFDSEYTDVNGLICYSFVIFSTLLLPFLYRYLHKHTRYGFLFLLPPAILCSFIAVPSLSLIWTDWFLSILYIIGFLSATFALFRKWSILLWAFWLLPSICVNFASVRYHITLNPSLMSEIIGASPQDVEKFLTPTNLILCAAAPVLALIISCAIFYFMQRFVAKNIFVPGALMLILALTVATVSKRLYLFYKTPETHLLNLYETIQVAKELQSDIMKRAEELPSAATPPPSIPPKKQSKECICLLHIGESVRSDHLSLFGYSKTTTPNLDRNKHLIAYQDCVSSAPFTISATFSILTNAKTDIREENFDRSLDASCGGIMDIFRFLNFSCFAFVNKEETHIATGALYEKLLGSTFASGADKIFVIPNLNDSHSQIQQIHEVLNSAKNKQIFCLINNFGSHVPYYDYDKLNPPFTPASKSAHEHNPGGDENVANIVRNTYDCTIHYWDAYVDKLLSGLKGKPFIYLYISDHGDFLGDEGLWIRTGGKQAFFRTPVCQVPFIIITSEEFEQQNPHFVQALERLKEHQSMSIGQEHIFHTLLGIFGIQSPYYEEELDLTSDKVKPYTGPHPSRGGRSADGKKWY